MDVTVLRSIANASAANADFYVSAAEGKPLLQHQPALIAVDPAKNDPNDPTKIAARITADGVSYLQEQTGASTEHTKPVSAYSVETAGFVAPKVKRGGGGRGAPSKYQFDTMEVGAFFFVPNTDVKDGDAVKTVGSAVGAANQKYAEPTGEMKTVTRAKRDSKNKAIKDPVTGEIEKETVTIPVKKAARHYKVSRVESGKTYGSWTAPADGAVVSRAA